MNKIMWNLEITDKRGKDVRIIDIIDSRASDYANFINNISLSLLFHNYELLEDMDVVKNNDYIIRMYKFIHANKKDIVALNCKICGTLNYEQYEEKPVYADVYIVLNGYERFNNFYDCEDYIKQMIHNLN